MSRVSLEPILSGWGIPNWTRQSVWWEYRITLPHYALPAALLCGMIIALLPVFREDAQGGLCPQCHYKLGMAAQAGCSECGWNRDDLTVDACQRRLFNLSPVWRQRAWLLSGWSAIVFIVILATLAPLRSVMPYVTPHRIPMIFTEPRSNAYAAIKGDLKIDVLSFGQNNSVIKAHWTGAPVERDHSSYKQWKALRARGIYTEAPDEFIPIAEVDADLLTGRSVYQWGDDTHVDVFDADAVADWMQGLFPDIDRRQLYREAEVVFAAVDLVMQEAADGGTFLVEVWYETAGAFGGVACGGIRIPDPRRLWYPGVAIVTGIVVAIWLYGVWVIFRWTKPQE